jgi:hypothetical protein
MPKVQDTSIFGFSEHFKAAASDYLFLLEHRYPQKAVLKLVGDRYALSAVERTMLYRGICDRTLASARNKKNRTRPLSVRSSVHIDTYNVLITIGSYLNGSKVFISLDGFLRDASEIHGKAFRNELFSRSIDLILDFLSSSGVKSVCFYLDRPVSHSGELAEKITASTEDYGLKGLATVHDSADYILKKTETGIIATSDSAIIDHSLIPVYDLARHTIEHHFTPKFQNLSLLLKNIHVPKRTFS